MQLKCAPCTWNDSCANDASTTACPGTRQCDRKCCDDTATSTCQPQTSEWPFIPPPPPPPPPLPPLSCDCQPAKDSDDRIKESCEANDDHPSYRSPQRSSRLFSPVYPTKVKPRKKRSKKATTAVGAGKLKQRDETKENDEKELDGAGGGVGAGQPTASKSSPTTKSPKLKTPTSPRTTAKPKSDSPSPDVLYLRRRSNKKAAIDWKKPPKIPVKHTATSKARNENWFADCGRYRVKAFRGDWDNMPDELSADYELYERFFKHRKPVKKNTSLVKKLVEGKIDLQKPPIENKPFRKRSPVLPTASEKPKRKPKLKSSLSFRFGARGPRADLRKQPLIQVKETLTSSMRRDLDGHYCQKSQKPTYWHGSVEEMEQLKKKIDERRGQLRNYWRKNDDQRQQQQQEKRGRRSRKVNSESVNNLMVASSNPSTVLEPRAHRTSAIKTKKQTRPRTRKSNNEFVNLVKYSKSHPAKPTADDVQNVHKAIAIKVIPASESIMVSGHANHHHHETRTIVDVLSKDCNVADTAKWSQPPTIPIRHSLTSMMRQRSTNKISRRARKAAPQGFRVAR